jgi:starch synthase
MESPRILFVCSEIHPYLPESHISKICQELPPAIQERGFEIRTFMPRFGCVNERRNQLHEVIRLSGLNLIINDSDHPLIIKVASISAARMQIYFIDNEDYFQRKTLYRNDTQWFPDNDERSIFFVRGVLETVRKLRWSPDIVHCHGWFSLLLALYLRRAFKDDPLYTNSKIILSLYNEPAPAHFSENFKKNAISDGVKNKDLDQMTDPSFDNLIKTCINFADGIILGSPEIKEEFLDYAVVNRKHILEYQTPDEYVRRYAEFYESLLTKRRRKSKKIV